MCIQIYMYKHIYMYTSTSLSLYIYIYMYIYIYVYYTYGPTATTPPRYMPPSTLGGGAACVKAGHAPPEKGRFEAGARWLARSLTQALTHSLT